MLVFMMACIGFPIVGSTWSLVLVGEVCIGTCGEGGLYVVRGLCGNSSWACTKASLISFGGNLILFVGFIGG